MSGYTISNEEFNKDLNTDNSFNIKSIINFIIDKHKQLFLLLFAVLIILVVDYITYYNNLFYAMAPVIPQPNKIKSNTFKRKSRKFKNN
jgi:hypothetical protein